MLVSFCQLGTNLDIPEKKEFPPTDCPVVKSVEHFLD